MDRLDPPLGNDLVEVRNLAASEKLNALIGEGIEKSRKSKTRTVEIRNGNVPNQSPPPANAPEIKGIVFLEIEAQEVEYGKPL
jgi:hypothetical protein